VVARYLQSPSFVIQLASGAAHHVEFGAKRDSTHAAVTGTPAAWWSASPLAAAQVDPKLFASLAAYPGGEIS
jgi:hypothetical protein